MLFMSACSDHSITQVEETKKPTIVFVADTQAKSLWYSPTIGDSIWAAGSFEAYNPLTQEWDEFWSNDRKKLFITVWGTSTTMSSITISVKARYNVNTDITLYAGHRNTGVKFVAKLYADGNFGPEVPIRHSVQRAGIAGVDSLAPHFGLVKTCIINNSNVNGYTDNESEIMHVQVKYTGHALTTIYFNGQGQAYIGNILPDDPNFQNDELVTPGMNLVVKSSSNLFDGIPMTWNTGGWYEAWYYALKNECFEEYEIVDQATGIRKCLGVFTITPYGSTEHYYFANYADSSNINWILTRTWFTNGVPNVDLIETRGTTYLHFNGINE